MKMTKLDWFTSVYCEQKFLHDGMRKQEGESASKSLAKYALQTLAKKKFDKPSQESKLEKPDIMLSLNTYIYL